MEGQNGTMSVLPSTHPTAAEHSPTQEVYAMKRNYRGVPSGMVQTWGQVHEACQTCRRKKRRCDRQRPCWSCTQRGEVCEERGQDDVNEQSKRICPLQVNQDTLTDGERHPIPASSSEQQIVPLAGTEINVSRLYGPQYTPFATFAANAGPVRGDNALAGVHQLLPPLKEARWLFNNLTTTMHHTIGILHIPSTRQLMEEAYRSLCDGKPPDLSITMLLFAVFAVSAAFPPPALLRSPEPAPEQAVLAYQKYLRTARSIMQSIEAVSASTTALAALTLLAYLATNDSGHGLDGHLLRSRCYWMAQTMGIHRLDTPQRREERKANGYNVIELEVQRRIWWNLVATDWLSAFSGGTQEGTYFYHPNHMCVDLPRQLDDTDITSTGYRDPKPISEPIALTFLIGRARLASICREVVDSMPSIALGVEPSYDTILALDARFHNYLAELPPVFQLNQKDPQAIQTTWIENPYTRWQRITAHLSVHTRLCRLHRPYHLKGMTNPKYKYSRDVCVRSAQIVLDLRRSMDDKQTNVGLTPDRFWVVAQHVFSAALTLATDVSFDGSAPDAAERKAKVLAAYDILERSKDGSCGFRETIEKNLRTLMATLNRRGRSANDSTTDAPSEILRTPPNMNAPGPADTFGLTGNDEESTEMIAPWDADWDKLWSEFLTVAPDLDLSQWDQLLEGTEPLVP